MKFIINCIALACCLLVGGFAYGSPWQQSESYSGNCQATPTGTLCVRFEDGFIWLMHGGVITAWEKRVEGGQTIQVVITTKNGRDYFRFQHILGTNYVCGFTVCDRINMPPHNMPPQQNSAPAIIPMDVDASWLFAADVRWTIIDSDRVRKASIRWEMRITEAFESDRIRAAVVRGFPSQLAWYEPGKQPGFDVLVARPDGLFLAEATSEDEAREIAKRAVAGKPTGEMFLRIPVRVGDCVGRDPEAPDRTDNLYCWYVERRVKERGVSGWELSYRTMPAHEFIDIVPGLGVTRFIYEHHGTVASVDARLVSYSPGRR